MYYLVHDYHLFDLLPLMITSFMTRAVTLHVLMFHSRMLKTFEFE